MAPLRMRTPLTERVILIGIVMLGFYFRVANVFDQAPLTLDSWYVFGAKRMLVTKSFPDMMKPLWEMLIAGGYVFLGHRFFAASLISVFFGTLTIAVVVQLGFRMFGRSTGLYAGTVAASLLGYIHLSRWTQGQMTSIFFLLSAALVYEAGVRASSRRQGYLFLAGVLAGATLPIHPQYISICVLVPLWESARLFRGWRSHILSLRQGIVTLVVLVAGIALPITIGEVCVHMARLLGIPAGSWMASLYLQLTDTKDWRITSMHDLTYYWRAFVEYEGVVVAMLLTLGTIVLAFQVFKQKGSALRGFSILLVPFVLLELSMFTKGIDMPKNYAVLLPGAPIVLGYLFAQVEGSIIGCRPKWYLRRSVIALALTLLISTWGYLHAHSRIQWKTGHNAAYLVVQDYAPERIFYSGAIWEFFFGGSDNAVPLLPDINDVLEKGSQRDVLVITQSGACDAPPQEVTYVTGYQTQLLETVPAFMYVGHSIEWNRTPLAMNSCHLVYSIGHQD